MVIEPINAKRNLNLKANVTDERSMCTNILNAKQDIEPNRTNCESYTWCRWHYYGEFGHIGANCVKHHMRTRDTARRCFIFIELGHLANNCMNTRRT